MWAMIYSALITKGLCSLYTVDAFHIKSLQRIHKNDHRRKRLVVMILSTHLCVVGLIQRETVINAFWENNEVTLFAMDPDPPILQVSDVKVT